MKKRSAIIIAIILAVLASVMVYIFFIRGNQEVIETEESVEVPESTASPESTQEPTPESTPKPISTPEPTPESTATPEPTEPPITKNEDGTYTFSEEFISSLSTFDYFEGASTEMMIDYLTKIAKTLKSTNEKDFQLALTQMGEDHRLIDVWGTPDEYSTRKHPDQQPQQPQQSTPSTDTNTTNNSSSSTTNTTTGGSTTTTTQTPPESSNSDDGGYVTNEDGTRTSSDGTFTFDAPIGGGERIDSGAVITTPGDASNSDEVAGSMDDMFGNMGDFGGGGQAELPEGFTGIY